MTKIVFPAPISTEYSDDGSTSNDMQGGGHRQHLLPMIGDTIGWVKGVRTGAQFSATSNTSDVTIGTGTKTLVLNEDDRAFTPGARLRAADAGDPANFMDGLVTAYDDGTDQLTIDVDATGGSGTPASWEVGYIAPGVSEMTGATASTAGTGGTVPAPAAGDQGKVLLGDATWGVPVPEVASRSISSNLALTEDDEPTQSISATSADLTVSLPDATTMSAGQSFTLRNTGDNAWTLLDGAGAFMGTFPSGASATFVLLDNGAAAGSWWGRDLQGVALARGRTATTVEAVDPQIHTAIDAIDSTRMLVAYEEGATGNGRAAILDVSDPSAAVVGTPVDFSGSNIDDIDVVVLDSSTAVVAYREPNTEIHAQVLSIGSGTSLTANTVDDLIVQSGTNTLRDAHIEKVSSSRALIVYTDSTGDNIEAVFVDVSGTGLTASAIDVKSFGPDTMASAAVISSSIALIGTTDSGNNDTHVHKVDISGASPVIGSDSQLRFSPASSIKLTGLVRVSDTQAAFIIEGNVEGLMVGLLDAETLSVQSSRWIWTTSFNPAFHGLAITPNGLIVVAARNLKGAVAWTFRVSGESVFPAGAPQLVYTAAGVGPLHDLDKNLSAADNVTVGLVGDDNDEPIYQTIELSRVVT